MTLRQKPNGMWVVDYDDNGMRRRVSTGIKTPPQRTPPANAKAAAREIVMGVRPSRGGFTLPHQAHKADSRLTMSELFDRAEKTVWHPDNVRSQSTIRSNLKVLRSFIGPVPVVDMSYTRIEQLVSDMKERGYQPATIKRKLSMVGKALKMATMWTDEKGQPLLASKPPLPQIVVNNLKDRTISPTEEAAIFAAVEKRRQVEPHRQWFKFRVLLWLLFDTAGRVGETITLGPKAVSELSGTSFITFPRYHTKSGKPRTVPLAPRSVEGLGSLMDHLVRKGDDWQFFGFGVNLAQNMFRQIKRDILTETGINLEGVTLHTIRHTTLTRLAQGGLGLAQLQLWAGHSDPKITAERYLHLRPSDLVSGLALLSGTGSVNAHISGTRHDNVPSTLPAAKGDSRGTATLQ
jgi:integrase